jgi:hypothetical protein
MDLRRTIFFGPGAEPMQLLARRTTAQLLLLLRPYLATAREAAPHTTTS